MQKKKTGIYNDRFFFLSAKADSDPEYQNVVSGYKLFHSKKPFPVRYNNGVLPELKIAYETWGELNEAKDNVVIISTGLSANSHARSHPVSTFSSGTHFEK